MKKLLILLLFLPICLFAQTVDKVIITPIYTSYFCYSLHEPLYVKYELYKGGGTCSRSDMKFSDGGFSFTARENDYRGNGYDIGHMCNAEDFAYNSKLEELTFRFYNALPQTAKLNRGTWKALEYKTRKQSQTFKLEIICGGYSFTKRIGSAAVPDFCFKVIKNESTGETHCYIFPNDDSDSFSEVSFKQLQILTKYNLPL